MATHIRGIGCSRADAALKEQGDGDQDAKSDAQHAWQVRTFPE